MHFTSLLLSLLPLTLAAPPIGDKAQSRSRARSVKENQLAKRQTYGGRATFYDVGLGACGWHNVESDYIVALNTPQYGGGYPGPNCGRSITISANGVTVQAQIADQCPSCGYGDLDLSRSLFNRFASPDAGVFQMSWWYNDGNSAPQPAPQPTTTTQAPPPPPPTSTYTPPPPTSTYTPPPPPTSTSTPPASTTPSSTPASSAAAQSSSVESISSGPIPSATSSGSTLPFVVTSEASNSTASATSSADQSTETNTPNAQAQLGNLILFNQVVTYLGNIVVVGANQD